MKKSLFVFGVFLLLITGCKPTQTIQYVDREVVRQETIRDTTLVFQKDSSYVRAWLECDSTNQVVLKQLETIQGREVTQSIVFKTIEKLKYIEVKAEVDSNTVYFAMKDRFESSVQIEYKEVIKEKRIYPRFLVVFAVLGGILAGYLLFKVFMWVKKKLPKIALK